MNKSEGIKFVDLAGNAIGPLLPFQHCERSVSKYGHTSIEQCGGAQLHSTTFQQDGAPPHCAIHVRWNLGTKL